MIFRYADSISKCIVWTALIVIVCSAYAYAVNARCLDNDPKKKAYSPFAILIAPFTFPLLISIAVVIFVIEAMLFGVFILLFSMAMIAIRKPFLFVWLDKIALKIGEPLLKFNTYLLRLAFTPWDKSSPSA